MNISKISSLNTIQNLNSSTQKNSTPNITLTPKTYNNNNITSAHFIANYTPISFKGNAPEIKNAFIITSSEDIPIVKSTNGSYIVEFDTQTEAIYGKDAIKYIKNKDYFKYDTQIIFPKKAQGYIEVDGKKIDIKENSGIIISKDTNAKIKITKGYPLILTTKCDFEWYSRHSKDSDNTKIRDKFIEMMQINAHLYNGEITPTLLIDQQLQKDSFLNKLNINKYQEGNNLIYALYDKKEKLNEDQKNSIIKSKELLDKLYNKGIIDKTDNNYIKFKTHYVENYAKEMFKQKGFTDEEIEQILPIYNQSRQLIIDSCYTKQGKRNGMSEETIQKLKDANILYKANDKKHPENIYWRTNYESESQLRYVLNKNNIEGEEQDQVVQAWHIGNKIGFDFSGLKFLSDKVAIYNLDDKVNNWTQEKSCWLSNSTAIISKNRIAPTLGASIVQSDITTPIPMDALRKEEHLHTHPADDDQRQTEIYIITSGYAALNIVKNGKPEVKVLKEGDMAVIAPSVAHCINSIMGEYEQIVTQIPSAFQYGFGFKRNYDMPEGYTEKDLVVEAFTKLLNAKEEDKKTSFLKEFLNLPS